MKKLSLICLALLTALSLSACGNQSHHSKSASTHSSKVVKHHHKKHSKKKKTDKQSSSFASQSSQTQAQSQQNNQYPANNVQQSNGPTDEQIQEEIHRRNTAAQHAREQPYKGYSSYYDYRQGNPNQPYSENDDPAYTTGAIPRDGN